MSKPLALIIEDDFDAGAIMSEALSAAGFTVELFRDGTTAQKRLAGQPPQLIALDLHLPGVNGQTLLRQIRSDDRLAQTRVMLVTADDHLGRSLQKEANFVLLKPISFTQLWQLAQRLRPSDVE